MRQASGGLGESFPLSYSFLPVGFFLLLSGGLREQSLVSPNRRTSSGGRGIVWRTLGT